MKKYVIMASLLLLLLLGCTPTPPVRQQTEYRYHTQEITYSEEYALRVSMDCTETKRARYYFETTIEESDRAHCIEVTDSILAKQRELDLLPEIFVFTEERYPDAFIDGNRLYLPVQDWQTVEYAANVLLAAYGAYCHYGVAYGYANLICNNVVPDGKIRMPSVTDACDLNLLCFDESFMSEGDISAVKGIACSFSQSYAAAKGEAELQELLAASGTAEGALHVSKTLEQYYRDNGVDYTPASLRFGYGGETYSYILLDDLAGFYVSKNWKDMYAQVNPLVYEGFLHQNYSDAKAFFQINLEQMRQYQKLFALDPYKNDLRVLFDNSNMSKNSLYRSDTHTIHLKNVDSLMHEYIHALTLSQPQASMNEWEMEGFARYFSYRYDHYGMAFLNQDYNNLPNTAELKYVHEYLATINRPIDMAKDYPELENIAVYSRSLKNPNANYVAGSSFVQYLVKQYGERAVIDSIYGDKTPLPKSYTELVSDWSAYIESTYQNYSKYVKQKPVT